MNIAFRVADEQGLLLLDMKDLRAILANVAENAKALTTQYGNVSKQTVGTIQRQLLVLENQGGNNFFGEPALMLQDLMRTDKDGRGFVNILVADRLMQNPKLYATFLLWMLSELFEQLPEVGDLPKPKLVFFFDEAHLLFDDAPDALMDKIEQVVRLIRSKGVGVYFVTQNPIDVPEKVLAQLGNRVQHALRAFTPRDQKSVAAAAQTFRPNPKLDTQKVITELGKGEALVSFLEGNGTPSIVERIFVRPPSARIGPITPEERKALMSKSPVKGKYDTPVDSESAFEMLQKRVKETAAEGDGGSAGRSGRRRATAQRRARTPRRHRRHHLRHQPQARHAADHRAGHRPRPDAIDDQPRRRPDRRPARQVGRGPGWRHRHQGHHPRRAGRNAAALIHARSEQAATPCIRSTTDNSPGSCCATWVNGSAGRIWHTPSNLRASRAASMRRSLASRSIARRRNSPVL